VTEGKKLKVAAVTEDGIALSNHFGMAPAYRVFSIQDGHILAGEMRQKPHHAHHPQGHSHGAGMGHADMFAPIRDCQVLICGGMGSPAYESALSAGLQVVLTGGEIQAALQAYLAGELQSDLRRIHRH